MKKAIAIGLAVACLAAGAARAQDTTIVDTPSARSVKQSYGQGRFVNTVTESVDRRGNRCRGFYHGVRTHFGTRGHLVRRCWRRY
jgi:hypothetical protein